MDATLGIRVRDSKQVAIIFTGQILPHLTIRVGHNGSRDL